MTNPLRILLVHNALPSFVQTDRDILAESYHVHELKWRWQISTLSTLLPTVAQCDVVYVWFAGHHSFFPSLLGKALGKTILSCSSDYDIANEPWFDYGSMRRGWRRYLNNLIFRLANKVIVPSDFSRKIALE